MSETEPVNAPQWVAALRWLAFAREDLLIARLASGDTAVLHATAFRVRQAVEKILKALLTAAAADFRRIHDIEELANLAHRTWPAVIPVEFPLARATVWYVASRYPGIDDVSITQKEVAVAPQEAEAFYADVMQLVPAGLKQDDGTISDASG